ncbi:hypothetical protein AAGS61_15325 [Lysinibacillus sp. KU-BSD001]|uniref:hypothetical protein n=1 Tax=Lysinibacillus sp. KU-BSD001 TaxID=3141328 RepID=UPI0036E3FD8A
MSKKEMGGFLCLLAITIYFGGTLISYIKFENPSFGTPEILLIIALVISWGQFFTWHTRKELQKDEMGKQIVKNSAYKSHHIIFGALLILWVIDFFFISYGKNYTLFIALCIAYITNPLMQFIQVKKYM